MFSVKSIDTRFTPLWKKSQQERESWESKLIKIDKILQVRSQRMKGVRDFQYNWEMYFQKEVEVLSLECEYEEGFQTWLNTWKPMHSMLFVNRSNTTYKKITPVEQRALEREPCGICMETRDAKHLTTTQCGHTFCRPCFSKLIKQSYYDNKDVCCPYCRNEDFTLTRYYK